MGDQGLQWTRCSNGFNWCIATILESQSHVPGWSFLSSPIINMYIGSDWGKTGGWPVSRGPRRAGRDAGDPYRRNPAFGKVRTTGPRKVRTAPTAQSRAPDWPEDRKRPGMPVWDCPRLVQSWSLATLAFYSISDNLRYPKGKDPFGCRIGMLCG